MVKTLGYLLSAIFVIILSSFVLRYMWELVFGYKPNAFLIGIWGGIILNITVSRMWVRDIGNDYHDN